MTEAADRRTRARRPADAGVSGIVSLRGRELQAQQTGVRIRGKRAQHRFEVAGHKLHRRLVEQFDVVVELRFDPLLEHMQLKRQLKAREPEVDLDGLGVRARQLQARRIAHPHAEVDLEQRMNRGIAARVDGLDDKLQRHLLMLVGGEH